MPLIEPINQMFQMFQAINQLITQITKILVITSVIINQIMPMHQKIHLADQ